MNELKRDNKNPIDFQWESFQPWLYEIIRAVLTQISAHFTLDLTIDLLLAVRHLLSGTAVPGRLFENKSNLNLHLHFIESDVPM